MKYSVFLLFFISFTSGDKLFTMNFRGQGYYRCPKFDTNETLVCMSTFKASLEYNHTIGDLQQNCTFKKLISNFTEGVHKPECNLLFMFSIPTSSGSNMARYFPQQQQGLSECIGDLEIELNRDCQVLLSPEEADFLRMCNAFGVKDSFRNCKCDMFSIQHEGYTKNLCDLLASTKSYRTKSVSFKNQEENGDEINYKTILQRSCVHFKKRERLRLLRLYDF